MSVDQPPRAQPQPVQLPDAQAAKPAAAKAKPRLNLDDLDLVPTTTSDERAPGGSASGVDTSGAAAQRDAELRRQRPPHHGS